MPTKQEIATNPTTTNDNELIALLRAYNFEGADVRVTDRNGDPWFVLTDVCRSAGISDPTSAARRLDADEKMPLDIRSLHGSNIRSGNFNGLGSFGAMPDRKSVV